MAEESRILIFKLLILTLTAFTWSFVLYQKSRLTVYSGSQESCKADLLFNFIRIQIHCVVLLVCSLRMDDTKEFSNESCGKEVPTHVESVENQGIKIAVTTKREQREVCIRRELSQYLSSTEICCAEVCKQSKGKGDNSENQPLTNSNDTFEVIFNEPGFRVRPQTLIVGIVNGPSTVISGIPWSWLNEEKWRLHTFAKYPNNTAKSAILLAEDGFAYNGTGADSDDLVVCFFCAGSKQGWREEESIKETHRGLNSTCPMVTGARCNNVPMSTPSNLLYSSQGNEVPGAGALHQAQANPESIEIDAGPITGPETGFSEQGAQAQPAERNFGSSDQQNQMASRSVKSQPSDESGPSGTVTSGGRIPDTRSGNNNVPQPVGHNDSRANTNASSLPDNQPSNSLPASQSVPAAQTTQPSNIASTQSAPVNQSTAPNGSGNQPNTPANPQNPTYYQLGIITERPKRYEYAVRLKRYETFADWPANHHLKKEDLADAGFYYAGYGDCARCFYCGGGLRNWERDDDVWVEHARWFPKCAFIRQRVGQVFIDTVAHFAEDHEKITFKMVVEKMCIDPATFQIDSKETPLKNDPAVVTVKEMGYEINDIIGAAALLKENSQILSADELFETLETKGAIRRAVENPVYSSIEPSSDVQREQEMMEKIKKSNNDLRLQYLCKICMDKEVAVVFLPCGHMVCCTECSAAMRDCPVCRKQVKGVVRGFMG